LSLYDIYDLKMIIIYRNQDLLRSWMPAMDQVLAKVDTDGKVLGTSINLSLETLMVVHQQLHTGHITVTINQLGSS